MIRSTAWSTSSIAILLGIALPGAAASAEFRWVDDAEKQTADLLLGDQPVLRYMYAFDTSTPERAQATFKPFHHVFGPGTGRVITDGAGGKYPHHRGLFVGWNHTKTDNGEFDFWHCREGVHQRHAKFREMKVDAERGSMTAEIHWNDAQGKPVISERRSVSVARTPSDGEPGYGWQIDWQSVLSSNRGKIQLDGDRQHAGFQYRAAQEIAETDSARYIRPEGFPSQPEAVEVDDKLDSDAHVDLGWFAITYELDGTRYNVEYFEDPSLPKPSRYSERPYGRFGAFFSSTLTPDKPLKLRYRLRVTSGPAPERAAIQQRYAAFVAELQR